MNSELKVGVTVMLIDSTYTLKKGTLGVIIEKRTKDNSYFVHFVSKDSGLIEVVKAEHIAKVSDRFLGDKVETCNFELNGKPLITNIGE